MSTNDLPLLSDALLLKWMRDNMFWDGHGYWLPDLCIRERNSSQDVCPEPTMAEFKATLSEHARQPSHECRFPHK